MSDTAPDRTTGHYNVLALAKLLPTEQETTIADRVLTDRDAASTRLIRTLAPVPAHYHATCDEYVYILEGSGTVWLEDPRHETPFNPGDLLFFARDVVHAMPQIFSGSVLSFSVDTPRRDPHDVIMIDDASRPFSQR